MREKETKKVRIKIERVRDGRKKCKESERKEMKTERHARVNERRNEKVRMNEK